MYLPLFDIEVKHQFFTSGMHRKFTISPTVRTEALAAQLGVSSQQTPDGIRPNAPGDRVLKARMPGAEVGQMYLEQRHETDVAISEIFINGT